MRKLFYILILPFLFLTLSSKAQMVNVESLRKVNDSSRFILNANLNFQIQSNNDNNVKIFGMDLLSQMKSKNLKNIFFVIGNSSYNNTNNKDISNSNLLHLRYNRLITNYLRLEIFTQFQNNRVMDLKFRNLYGIGPRFIFFSKTDFKVYIGTIYMIENERLYDNIQSNSTVSRLSSYISLDFSLPKDLGKFSSVSYYQPRLDFFKDYRFTNRTELSITIYKNISFLTQLNYYYDAFPPNGIANNNFELKNGIKLIF